MISRPEYAPRRSRRRLHPEGAAPERVAAAEEYAGALGMAFQIVDDLLDVLGDPAKLGKDVRHDADQGKKTLVARYGEEGCRGLIRNYTARAAAAAGAFPDPTPFPGAGAGAVRPRSLNFFRKDRLAMRQYAFLDQVNSLADLKALRQEGSFRSCAPKSGSFSSTTSPGSPGGHLASNLGAVELTVEIHFACFPRRRTRCFLTSAINAIK